MALDLLAAYGVVPRTVRLIRTYWDRLTMVAKAGGYLGCPFKGYQVVTQGDPLTPTIFNVVVDAVVRHWVMVVTPTEAVTETWTGHHRPGGIFLQRGWTCGVDPTREATEGI